MAFDAGAVEARLTLDRSQFTKELDAAKADADKMSGKDISVKIKADNTDADAKLDKTKAKADDLGRKTETIKVKADTTQATAALDKLREKSLGARAATSLKEKPWWMGPALLALPAAINLLGVAAGAATALGATFATGGIALEAYGQVTKGVLTQAATAAKAVTTAQTAYTAALIAGTSPAKAYRAEQAAIATAYAQMGPAQIALSKQLGALSTSWKNVQQAVTPAVAVSVTPWLKGITTAAGDLRPVVVDVSKVIGSLGTDFDALVNLPAFKTFRNFIAGTGSQVVGAGGGAILNFFQGFITLLPRFKPLITDVDTGITNLGRSFLGWSQSSQARADVSKFMAWVQANGPTVGTFLANIAKAIANFGGGLSAGGMTELRLISDFFGMLAKLPKSVIAPLTDAAGALLLLAKIPGGKKIITLGINWAGQGASALLKMLSGGKIDIGSKFGASAGMQKAGDTMVAAAEAMQKAADTMVGGSAEGDAAAGAGEAGGLGVAGAEAGEVSTATVTTIAGVAIPLAIAAVTAGVLLKWNAVVGGQEGRSGAAQKAITGKGPQTTGALTRFTPSDNQNPLNFKMSATTRADLEWIMNAYGISLPAAEKKAEAAGDNLNKLWAGAGLYLHNFSTSLDIGKAAQDQFTKALTSAQVPMGTAKTLVSDYTSAVKNEGVQSSAAKSLREQMTNDFIAQGMKASAAKVLVDEYTLRITANGTNTAAQKAARQQLITDLEKAGESAKQATTYVNNLTGAIRNTPKNTAIKIHVAGSGSYFVQKGGTPQPGTHARSGGSEGMAEGGRVYGAGGPTSDSIPAWLSAGEYVIKAAAVSRYGAGLFDKLNAMAMAGGGSVSGSYAGSVSGLPGFDSKERTATITAIEAATAAADAAAINSAQKSAQAKVGKGQTFPGGLGRAGLRQIENWWIGAGGPGGGTAHVAAAITGAESGFNPKIVQQGQPYATTGWGLWQITPGDSEPQAGINEQLLNGPSNAKAAVAKYRGAGGFSPWTTYEDGAYLQFMASGGLVRMQGGATAFPHAASMTMAAPGIAGYASGGKVSPKKARELAELAKDVKAYDRDLTDRSKKVSALNDPIRQDELWLLQHTGASRSQRKAVEDRLKTARASLRKYRKDEDKKIRVLHREIVLLRSLTGYPKGKKYGGSGTGTGTSTSTGTGTGGSSGTSTATGTAGPIPAWLTDYAPGAPGAAGITDSMASAGSGVGTGTSTGGIIPGLPMISAPLPGGGGGGFGGGGPHFPEPPGPQVMLLAQQNRILTAMAATARRAPMQTTAGMAQALTGVGRMARIRSVYRTR